MDSVASLFTRPTALTAGPRCTRTVSYLFSVLLSLSLLFVIWMHACIVLLPVRSEIPTRITLSVFERVTRILLSVTHHSASLDIRNRRIATHKDLRIDVGLFSFPFPRYYSSNDITSTVVRDKIVSGALEETHVADATL